MAGRCTAARYESSKSRAAITSGPMTSSKPGRMILARLIQIKPRICVLNLCCHSRRLTYGETSMHKMRPTLVR